MDIAAVVVVVVFDVESLPVIRKPAINASSTRKGQEHRQWINNPMGEIPLAPGSKCPLLLPPQRNGVTDHGLKNNYEQSMMHITQNGWW
jgi:hypothetical protein